MTGVGDVDPSDQQAFDALQARLVPLWSSLGRLNHDEQTIVVIPSADVDVQLSASELQAYEERFLFLLFLLRQPRARSRAPRATPRSRARVAGRRARR